jgi:hypothetical protein
LYDIFPGHAEAAMKALQIASIKGVLERGTRPGTPEVARVIFELADPFVACNGVVPAALAAHLHDVERAVRLQDAI